MNRLATNAADFLRDRRLLRGITAARVARSRPSAKRSSGPNRLPAVCTLWRWCRLELWGVHLGHARTARRKGITSDAGLPRGKGEKTLTSAVARRCYTIAGGTDCFSLIFAAPMAGHAAQEHCSPMEFLCGTVPSIRTQPKPTGGDKLSEHSPPTGNPRARSGRGL